MSEGVATFTGLSLDRSGRNLRLRFSLYSYDRYIGEWTYTGVHLDTPFFHLGEGRPLALTIEQVRRQTEVKMGGGRSVAGEDRDGLGGLFVHKNGQPL